MSINKIYHTLFAKIQQLRSGERKNRIKNFAWMMAGVFRSHSVHQSKIANEIPGSAVKLSKVQRLRRLLMNPFIRVRMWYKPIAQELLDSRVQNGQKIRLILDGTKVGFHQQLLMVALAYRRRALPLLWTWVKSSRGHSSAQVQLALLRYIHALLPPGAQVSVVGDSEFGAVEVLDQLDAWGWTYVLRQKSSHCIQGESQVWQPFGDTVQKMGQSVWLGAGRLTQKHAYPTNLLAHWASGEKEPWLLATNLPSKKLALKTYRPRMWIEEMYGDFKKHGFDLESTHLSHFLRLSRLTLAVALLYVWLVAFGSQTIKNSLRRLVDRADRRDLSIFRIGYDMLLRCLNNDLPFSIRSIPYLSP